MSIQKLYFAQNNINKLEKSDETICNYKFIYYLKLALVLTDV